MCLIQVLPALWMIFVFTLSLCLRVHFIHSKIWWNDCLLLTDSFIKEEKIDFQIAAREFFSPDLCFGSQALCCMYHHNQYFLQSVVARSLFLFKIFLFLFIRAKWWINRFFSQQLWNRYDHQIHRSLFNSIALEINQQRIIIIILMNTGQVLSSHPLCLIYYYCFKPNTSIPFKWMELNRISNVKSFIFN